MIRSILIACVVAGLAACGGDDDGGGTPDAATPAADVEVIALANCPATVAATVKTVAGMNAYMDGSPSIKVGQTIKFEPAGNHDMLSTGSVAFDTGATGTGACLKFNKAGTYPYKCSLHAVMTGTVTVTQ